MKIQELIHQPEGRRLEFKETLPTVADLTKTIVAFANDAGGELFVGIRNEPREVTGIAEEDLMPLEEQISNLIHDHCYPVIIPDISFQGENGKRFIKVQIYRGSNLPYYLKSKGKLEGTYIRVGSSNRQADAEIIAELERQKRNISFDSELVHDKDWNEINIEQFKVFYKEKTDEELDTITLRKLELLKEYQGVELPTNAFILFSEDAVKKELFPYAKIECARFKGTSSDVFIDQKTIDVNISAQAELAYDFVLRQINQGATVKGVYTESRWEYPVKAIREAIRNAVVHRDYSLTGKDIKIAIYDDMVEITSPGKLMPSIDFNEMEARQSDIRNKIIAPVFKKLGVIDQWGNGLKLIADELKEYPEIEFKWFERGLQFQVQFIKKDYIPQQELQPELQPKIEPKIRPKIRPKIKPKIQQELQQELQLELQLEIQQELKEKTLLSKVLVIIGDGPMSKQLIASALGHKALSGYLKLTIKRLIDLGLVEITIPLKPRSKNQQYFLSEKGLAFLKILQGQ